MSKVLPFTFILCLCFGVISCTPSTNTPENNFSTSTTSSPEATALPSSTITENRAQIDADFRIQFRTGELMPAPGIDSQLQSTEAQPDHILIQFWQIPDEATRNELENAGVQLLEYVPNNAWFAVATGETIRKLQQFEQIRWIGSIPPTIKIAPVLVENTNGRLQVEVRIFADVQEKEAVDTFDKLEASLIEKQAGSTRYLLEINADQIPVLAGEDIVQWIDAAPPPRTTLDE